MNRTLPWLASAVLALALGSSHLLDGPSDMQAEEDTAAAVRDGERWHAALAAQQAAHPDLWTDEQRDRAGAARVIARGVDR